MDHRDWALCEWGCGRPRPGSWQSRGALTRKEGRVEFCELVVNPFLMSLTGYLIRAADA